MTAHRGFSNLDATDCAILEILQRDGRESFTRIGQQIGMSSTTVAERVRRLEEDGVIQGYHADVVAARAGFPIMAFLLARPAGPDARFNEAVQSRLEILECYRVTGEVSFVVQAVFNDLEHLEELIDYFEQTSFVTAIVVLSQPIKRALPLRGRTQPKAPRPHPRARLKP